MSVPILGNRAPLTIRLIQQSDASDEPVYDQVARRHTIQRIEFDWKGATYVVDRDDAGPRGIMMRQAQLADEPGYTRIEIVARRQAPHEKPPFEQFLFRVHKLNELQQDAGGSRWSSAELLEHRTPKLGHDA